MNEIKYTPIGYYHTTQKEKYEAGRQPNEYSKQGVIKLISKNQYEQALTDLNLFSHIWIIFLFHYNKNWKPMIQPPRGSTKKVGVFATRAPYRPNPIGMSAVKIISIDKLSITIEGSDLLDETPILDIKPYLAYCDSIPSATAGWLNLKERYKIKFSATVNSQLSWLNKNYVTNIEQFIITQMEFNPFEKKRKRIKKIDEKSYELSYRTWRILFNLQDKDIHIENIKSGYSTNELRTKKDIYKDKNVHKKFNKIFNCSRHHPIIQSS